MPDAARLCRSCHSTRNGAHVAARVYPERQDSVGVESVLGAYGMHHFGGDIGQTCRDTLRKLWVLVQQTNDVTRLGAIRGV